MNVSNFTIVFAPKTLEEFKAALRDKELRVLLSEFGGQATVQPPAIAQNGTSKLSALTNVTTSEERELRDEWKSKLGKNFSFKKTLRSRYASPVEALRAWKNGEFSRADMADSADNASDSGEESGQTMNEEIDLDATV